jgi:hypothetical protein
MSSVGLSLGPNGGINAKRLALGDAPAVAAPADITGGVTEPPAPNKAESTPLMAAMAEGAQTLVSIPEFRKESPGYWIESFFNQSLR